MRPPSCHAFVASPGDAASRACLPTRLRARARQPSQAHGEYPPDGVYGALLGDDQIKKNWPGLTCERSDDDKWQWTDSLVQEATSGTDCTWGDGDYCLHEERHKSWRKDSVSWNVCM